MTLEQLRTLAAIAERGSFSAAAERLQRTQPAVTVSLQQLERSLGVKLIERRRSGLLLTAEGREFLPAVRQALTILDGARHSLSSGGGSPAARITIATTDTLATYRLPAVVARFTRRFPKVNLLIHSKQSRAAAEMVGNGEADVGFLPFEALGGELQKIEMGRTRELFVRAARGGPLGNRRQVSVKELSGLPLIMLSADTLTRQVLEKIFAQAGAAMHSATEAISIEVIKAMVKSGLGAALLPDMAVEPERKAGSLVVATIREITPRPWGACIRRSAAPGLAVRSLLDAGWPSPHA